MAKYSWTFFTSWIWNSRKAGRWLWTRRLTSGEGIQYLPVLVDIKGLTMKLNLLLAEFAAGNTSSTRKEIVYILDELLRRKKISRAEYRDINSIKMLVGKSRGDCLLWRILYIRWTSRKILSSGLKNAKNTGVRSAIAQKVADAVVNGVAMSATQKAVEGAVIEAINKVKPHVLGRKKHHICQQLQLPTRRRQRLKLNSVIR